MIATMIAGSASCSRSYPSTDNTSTTGTSTAGASTATAFGTASSNIPDRITSIAVSGPLTQIIVYAFAPELLVGFSSDWSETARQYIPERYLSLPVLGQLYGGKGTLNLEELLVADPDIVLDIGEPKDSISADMDSLSEMTGIPFIHLDATIDTMGDTLRQLGELTGLTDRAEEYASYCEKLYGRTLDIMEQVGDNKVKVLYCMGDNGCSVIAKNSYHSEVLDLMTDNVAVIDSPSSKGTGSETDLEQILVWDPDHIIFEKGSIFDSVASDPAWQSVRAIQSGHLSEAPADPYNWLGFPPSIQRYLGMLWLADLLYPEYCDYDLKTEVKEFYRMFYHIELTDDQYDLLIK